MKEIELKRMWALLEKYFCVDNVLEVGMGVQNCEEAITKNAKNIERITISKEILQAVKKEYSHSNINYKLMNVEKLDYPDRFFDVVFSTGYHEFSFGQHGFDVHKKALGEMYRVLSNNGVFVFVEPKESSVTNELFKVFNANENHANRIKKSFSILSEFIKDNDMKIELNGETKVSCEFDSEKQYIDTMLDWWNDVKIPKDDKEKDIMSSKIRDILSDAGMLKGLRIFEDTQFLVIRKA